QDVETVPVYGNHAFLAVVGRGGGWQYIEALPERSDYGNWGNLIAHTGTIALGSTKGQSPRSGDPLRGGEVVCDQVDQLFGEATAYNRNPVAYNGKSANPFS